MTLLYCSKKNKITSTTDIYTDMTMLCFMVGIKLLIYYNNISMKLEVNLF